jgi:ubiquinone/menaquinone biosynthesis C-methylase UbiE
MDARAHWESVYTRVPDSLTSWYQEIPTTSLELIEHASIPHDSPILDAGGGDSTLVDHLLRRGYTEVAVLDVSRAALDRARARLAGDAARVRWLLGDILRVCLGDSSIALWHDRAAFHFLTGEADRAAYVAQLQRILMPNGQVIIATFADDGPALCSGLPVVRYSSDSLSATLGSRFRLEEWRRVVHVTPRGDEQPFIYGRFVLLP